MMDENNNLYVYFKNKEYLCEKFYSKRWHLFSFFISCPPSVFGVGGGGDGDGPHILLHHQNVRN